MKWFMRVLLVAGLLAGGLTFATTSAEAQPVRRGWGGYGPYPVNRPYLGYGVYSQYGYGWGYPRYGYGYGYPVYPGAVYPRYGWGIGTYPGAYYGW